MKIQSINSYRNTSTYNQTFRKSTQKLSTPNKTNELIGDMEKNFTRAIIIALIVEVGMFVAACIRNNSNKNIEPKKEVEVICDAQPPQPQDLWVI